MLGVTIALTACNDPIASPTNASVLTVEAGNLQQGVPGYLLPEQITVRVDDIHGLPVAGATVRWEIEERGAVVIATSLTDANGIATTSWRLGLDEGEQRAFATVGTLSSATFYATARSAEVSSAGGPIPFQCGRYSDGVVRCWSRPGNRPPRATALDTDLRFTTLAYALDEWCGTTTSGAVACVHRNDMTPGGEFRPEAANVRIVTEIGVALSDLVGGGDPEYGTTWCGLATDSQVYCWGTNNYGQLGDGTRTSRVTPLPVSPELKARAVAVVGNSVCAVNLAGVPFCWGATSGQVTSDVVGADAVLQPTVVATQRRFTQLTAAADGSVCGLDLSLEIYCWGANQGGGLGRGPANATSTPTPILDAGLFRSIGATADGFLGVSSVRDLVTWGSGNGGTFPLPVHVLHGLVFASVLPGGGDGVVCLQAHPSGTRCIDRSNLPSDAAYGVPLPVYGIPLP
jgi:hypothetical protein